MRETVERIFRELQDFKDDAKVADYIPALAKVNPDLYAISVSTLGKENISVGDYSARFSIQSISKVFALTLVIKTIGDEIWNSVGREPSGTAFNSLIQIELEEGIPRNPFINAGALVVIDRLIDIYNDEKLGENESLTIRFVLQNDEKTMEEEDITTTMNSILDVLNKELSIGLRQ